MDFSSLFSKLSSPAEDSKSLGTPAITQREGKGCKRRGSRQISPPELGRPYKRQNDQKNPQWDHESRITEGPKRGKQNRGRGRDNNMYRNHRGQQEDQFRKSDGANRGKKSHRGGWRGNRSATGRSHQHAAPARERFMSQEFKDQNALVLDGQIVCRHFLLGNCIKGEECQMVHPPVQNDLIKELCKFYVVGFCSKGDKCPYMHNSFPCKFFHRRASCVNGENCKFSHSPLDSVTEPLLEAAMKAEREARECAERAALEETVMESTPDEEKARPDMWNPALPKFYNSLDNNSEETTEEDAPQQEDPPASEEKPTPVCYSVEAVLGPRYAKPSAGLFSYSSKQETPILPARPPDARQTKALRSVAAFVPSPPAASPAKKVSTPSPAARVQSPLTYDPPTSSFSKFTPASRAHRNLSEAPLTRTTSPSKVRPGESFTPESGAKTVMDATRHEYRTNDHQASHVAASRPLDRPPGSFKSLFSQPLEETAAPARMKSSPPEKKDDSREFAPSKEEVQLKEHVTSLVQSLETIQPDSSQKRKIDPEDEKGRSGEIRFKSLFSTPLPSHPLT